VYRVKPPPNSSSWNSCDYWCRLLDLYQSHDVFQGQQDWIVLAVGLLVSFISALLLIRALVAYVAKRDFMIFAWYRIFSGLIILLFAFTGWKLW
jgi:undecaprenyl-diphosphatase